VLALKQPDFGQVRVANELRKRVRTVWPRWCVLRVAGQNEQAVKGLGLKA